MDYLREGIHLRGFAQIEPLVAYKNEAFTLFQDLMHTIWSDFARMIFNVEVEVDADERPRRAVPRRAAAAAAARPAAANVSLLGRRVRRTAERARGGGRRRG